MPNAVKCGNCGWILDISKDPEVPCPQCGTVGRIVDVATIADHIGATDHFQAVCKRDGRPIAYRESYRPDGRAASADRDDNGSLRYSITGTSPQGEEETLKVARFLIQKLNRDGESWHEPLLLDSQEGGGVDCESRDTIDSRKQLQMQIVRAIVDPAVWQQLNEQRLIQKSNADPGELASLISRAIQTKAQRIPESVRRGLILVLDATLLPGIAFSDVTDKFRQQHCTWAKSLGFDAIWLVGPVLDLIERLDREIASDG